MSDNLTIELIAEQALSDRLKRMAAYDVVTDAKALEAMRAIAVDEKTQQILDLVILTRKRQRKMAYEKLGSRADLFDKVALPVAAAGPTLLTILDNSHVLAGPYRTMILVASYLFGGLAWAVFRLLNYRYGLEARVRLAELGKVD